MAKPDVNGYNIKCLLVIQVCDMYQPPGVKTQKTNFEQLLRQKGNRRKASGVCLQCSQTKYGL